MKASTLFPLILGLSALFAPALQAQVAIYSLRFESTGPNVNYQPYSEGFAVVPLTGGLTSFVLQLESGLDRQFLEAPDLGEFFVATQNGVSKGVLTNAETEGTPVNFFTLVGTANTTIRSNNGTVTTLALMPDDLDGFILTADPVGSTLFDVGAENTGSAGAAEVDASIDGVRTQQANIDGLTVEEALAGLVEELLAAGFTAIVAEAEDDADPDVDADADAAAPTDDNANVGFGN